MRVDIFSSDALKKLKGGCLSILLLLYNLTQSNTKGGLGLLRFVFCSASQFCLVLADKSGGKKFSKDFEEGSAQLQEFVKFFDKQNKILPQLLEALTNADIFYEMQYKEVKIVANVSDRGIHFCSSKT